MKLISIERDCVASLPGDFDKELVNQVFEANVAMYERWGFVKPWIAYFAVVEQKVVGTCAFKGPPVENSVEIAYFTFPTFERQGYATQMAASLIQMAMAEDAQIVIRAQTLPEKNVSNGILAKLGFKFFAKVKHPEDGFVWEWHL